MAHLIYSGTWFECLLRKMKIRWNRDKEMRAKKWNKNKYMLFIGALIIWKLVNITLSTFHISTNYTVHTVLAQCEWVDGWMGVWIYYYHCNFANFLSRSPSMNDNQTKFMFAISRSNQIEFMLFLSHIRFFGMVFSFFGCLFSVLLSIFWIGSFLCCWNWQIASE